jgi:hypothetical protein
MASEAPSSPPPDGTYGDGYATKPSLLRDAFSSIDNGSHTIQGVDDVTKLLENLELTVPTREDLTAVIESVAEEPSEINFVEFRRVVCISQNMLQEEEDGTTRTLMEVGGNRDQFIRVLDDHREECEKEGDYQEAKATYMRLCELRRDDDSRSRDELLYRQQVQKHAVCD